HDGHRTLLAPRRCPAFATRDRRRGHREIAMPAGPRRSLLRDEAQRGVPSREPDERSSVAGPALAVFVTDGGIDGANYGTVVHALDSGRHVAPADPDRDVSIRQRFLIPAP